MIIWLKDMSSTAMMESGIGCVLVVEAGQECMEANMLCVDNWDSAAKVCYSSYTHAVNYMISS